MNIVDLESFVAVVDHGSIVAAAAKLHLTQSAITRRIQNLEDSLGVTLLDRQTRPLQVTPEGKATYEAARPVLSSVDLLRSAVVHQGEPSGTFRFGVARGLGDGALLAPISKLHQEFPLLKVQAYSQWSESLIERVQSRSLDAAAILLPDSTIPPTNLACDFIGKQPFVVVSPNVAPANRATHLKDLSSRGWIVSPQGCGLRSLIESALSRQGLPFSIAVEAEGKDLHLTLVSQGAGLSIVPMQTFLQSPHRKVLSALRVKGFTPTQDLWIVCPKGIQRQVRPTLTLRTALAKFVRNA